MLDHIKTLALGIACSLVCCALAALAIACLTYYGKYLAWALGGALILCACYGFGWALRNPEKVFDRELT